MYHSIKVSRYQARLGSIMTKTLGRSALELAELVASHLLPIPDENRPGLVSDLEKDPFVGHALNCFMCEFYHKYDMFLAPFTAAILTAKHCRFEGSQKMGIPQHGIGGRVAVEKQDESAPSQTTTKVTKKKVKDPVKFTAGALGAITICFNGYAMTCKAEDLRKHLFKW